MELLCKETRTGGGGDSPGYSGPICPKAAFALGSSVESRPGGVHPCAPAPAGHVRGPQMGYSVQRPHVESRPCSFASTSCWVGHSVAQRGCTVGEQCPAGWGGSQVWGAEAPFRGQDTAQWPRTQARARPPCHSSRPRDHAEETPAAFLQLGEMPRLEWEAQELALRRQKKLGFRFWARGSWR